MTETDTHLSPWTGRQVLNKKPVLPDSWFGLGVIGAVTLIAGIVLLIVSANISVSAYSAIATSVHTSMVTAVLGSLLTLIGSIAIIAQLTVKAVFSKM